MKAEAIFQALQQGILICDKHAQIVFMNEAYGEFIHSTMEEAKGKKITEFRKDAMVPQVLKNGEAMENLIRKEGEQEYFASIYPILSEGKVIGSISVVSTLSSHYLRSVQMKEPLKEKVRKFEKQEILSAIDYYGDDAEGKKKAADSLGISLATLYNKLQD